MADQYAIQDQNQFPALTAHSDTTNDAETRRVVATDGALHVAGDLIEALQESLARVSALNAVITSGLPTLRISGAVTATGGGYVTSAQVIAALLTHSLALERYSANAVHSNINNVVIS